LRHAVKMLKFQAHAFFDPADAEHAHAISAELPAATGATVTSWLDRPGGPLPQAQFQAELTSAELRTVTEWLMLHREGVDQAVVRARVQNGGLTAQCVLQPRPESRPWTVRSPSSSASSARSSRPRRRVRPVTVPGSSPVPGKPRLGPVAVMIAFDLPVIARCRADQRTPAVSDTTKVARHNERWEYAKEGIARPRTDASQTIRKRS
jgi:aromatic ring-cleaving dioxygenase